MNDHSSSPAMPIRLERFIPICARFEALWAEGARPRIEDFLAGAEGRERAILLRELLMLEMHLRKRAGEQPTVDDYCERFPADLSTIEEACTTPGDPDCIGPAPGSSPSNVPVPGTAHGTETESESGQTTWATSSASPPEITRDLTARDGEFPPADDGEPRQIGRYRVLRRLGEGGMGRVYLAQDEDLQRMVAIKVPWPQAFRSPWQVAQFLDEARLVAQLRHPAIVAVHDVGRLPDGAVYIVLEYVEGTSMSDWLETGDIPLERLVELLARVAEAVHYAHRRGIIHRDLKPSNILVDNEQNPRIADFGLALHEDAQEFRYGEIAGTMLYMAPEQVRGEAHRLDGRTDLWAIGVILYLVLSGRRPFAGERLVLFDTILNRDPVPPRQIVATIPQELERICLKCLSKRMADRYATGLDLAQDLRHWLGGAKDPAAAADPGMHRLVPKGLRSFECDDAEFFHSLLPGPRNRDGLPASISFWKSRIESPGGEMAFRVGLLYGPTGCGKSSFVKAGLLPRLGSAVRPVYVEAAPEGTEARLLSALRWLHLDLPPDLGLSASAAVLRERARTTPEPTTVLIVLDQFEQWLHHHPAAHDSELLRALHQCDGIGLRALLLVRDDFWMAVTRFLHALEVPLVEGQNAAAMELFGAAHAARVLTDFGRALGQFPDRPKEAEPEAVQFIDEAVSELSGPDGSIIPIRLILFAEMVRHRPWRLESLRALGGIEGIGVTFLEETFDERSAPLTHRAHRRAAQDVLTALLPAPPSDLKGTQRSRRQLQEAAGYNDRQSEFDELMRILDNELRLVTPVDAQKLPAESVGPTAPDDVRFYQLTHDYLVPPLRQWLTRHQRETRTGRAELRLAERTALWTNKPEPKQLPNWWEWLGIRCFTARARWTAPQRNMMRAALRHHLRNMVILGSIASICLISMFYIKIVDDKKLLHAQVQEQVRQLWSIDLRYLPQLLDRLDDHPELWTGPVRQHVERPGITADERTRGLLALVRRDGGGLDELAERLVAGEPAEQEVLRGELRRWKDRIVPGLWRELRENRATGKRHLAAAAALADYDPQSPHWNQAARQTVRELIAQDPLLVNSWVEALRPVRDRLRPHLVAYFDDPAIGASQKPLVAGILADYASSDDHYLSSEVLARLMLDANPEQLAILFPIAGRRRADLVGRMAAVLGESVPLTPGANPARAVARQANAAEALLVLGEGERFWPLLRQSEDPRLRTHLIDRIGLVQLDCDTLLERFAKEQDGSIRQAILLGLEGVGSALEPPERARIAERLVAILESDPDGGVHSAAEWMLAKWGFKQELARAKRGLAGSVLPGKRWFITNHLHTMLVVPRPGRITVGSPEYEPGHEAQEALREATIDHDFAISAHEITIKQFRAYRPDPHPVSNEARPINMVSWFDAVKYCRWLSEQPKEGIPEEQRCYPALEEIGPSMRLPDDYLERSGYRLPTEDEWEYAIRAGSVTSRFFGTAEEFLDKYAWMSANSGEHVWGVGQKRPNPLGLFDVYGNLSEWCDLGHFPRPPRYGTARGGSFRSGPRFLRSSMRPEVELDATLSITGFRIVRTRRAAAPGAGL
jgi:serine/threonine protein kinase/formylglycine-generating enzyme required for sulfatase activity